MPGVAKKNGRERVNAYKTAIQKVDTEAVEAATDWLDEEHLILLQGWARDGLTYSDIAAKCGVHVNVFYKWMREFPEITKAVKRGREVVDYMVENALLKSALGYTCREVEITTIMRRGKVVEEQKRVLDKEQAPNVGAAKFWLINRCRDKWKSDKGVSLLDQIDGEDTSITIEVTRASNDESGEDKWNEEVKVRKATEEEKAQKEADLKKKKVEEDPDYWPDDWVDDDEDN